MTTPIENHWWVSRKVWPFYFSHHCACVCLDMFSLSVSTVSTVCGFTRQWHSLLILKLQSSGYWQPSENPRASTTDDVEQRGKRCCWKKLYTEASSIGLEEDMLAWNLRKGLLFHLESWGFMDQVLKINRINRRKQKKSESSVVFKRSLNIRAQSPAVNPASGTVIASP